MSALTWDLISCPSQYLYVIKEERLPISKHLHFIQVKPSILLWLEVMISAVACRLKRLTPRSVCDHLTSRESGVLHCVSVSMSFATDSSSCMKVQEDLTSFYLFTRSPLLEHCLTCFLTQAAMETQLSSFLGTSVFHETTWQGKELYSKSWSYCAGMCMTLTGRGISNCASQNQLLKAHFL